MKCISRKIFSGILVSLMMFFMLFAFSLPAYARNGGGGSSHSFSSGYSSGSYSSPSHSYSSSGGSSYGGFSSSSGDDEDDDDSGSSYSGSSHSSMGSGGYSSSDDEDDDSDDDDGGSLAGAGLGFLGGWLSASASNNTGTSVVVVPSTTKKPVVVVVVPSNNNKPAQAKVIATTKPVVNNHKTKNHAGIIIFFIILLLLILGIILYLLWRKKQNDDNDKNGGTHSKIMITKPTNATKDELAVNKELYAKIVFGNDDVQDLLDKEEFKNRRCVRFIPILKEYVDLLAANDIFKISVFKQTHNEDLTKIKDCVDCTCLHCTRDCAMSGCKGCDINHKCKVASCDNKVSAVWTFADKTIELQNNKTGRNERLKVLATIQDLEYKQLYIVLDQNGERVVLYYYPSISGDTYGEITDTDDLEFAAKALESAYL